MEKYIWMILSVSFVMSGVILGLILFNKLFSNKYSAKWRYYIWLVVLFGLLIPFRPDIALPFEPVQVSAGLVNSEQQNSAELNNEIHHDSEMVDGEDNQFIETETQADTVQKSTVVFIIWLMGVILTLGFYLWQHKKFSAMVKRWGTEITDNKILSVLQQAQNDLGIRQKIYIKKCKLITSPMITGFTEPVILLPAKTIHEDELLFIIKHELVHYRRKDLWVNLLVMCVKAIHWFNPVIHIMTAAICNDCEISCDEDVIGDTSSENRRTYCETIIGFIGTDKAVKSALSTNLYGGKNTMKKRIISIMNTGKKKTRLAFLCLALVVTATFLSGFVFAVVGSPADKVLETVLTETGGGTVVKCELDYLGNADAGIRIYEIEVINGDVKYEIEIDADDLTIYSYEEKKTDKNLNAFLPADTDLTPEKAIETALAKTGGGEVAKWELNGKYGNRKYKIEIAGEEIKYSMNVGAVDGEITNYKEKAIKSAKINKAAVSKPVLISAAEAKKIALAKTGGGTVEDCELDYEKGAWMYEIEVVLDKTEYEIEINAETGEVNRFKVDD